MKAAGQKPMSWTEELQEVISIYIDVLGFSCFEKNVDRGWASLQFGREFEAI